MTQAEWAHRGWGRLVVMVVAGLASTLGAAPGARAQEADHLKCYKVTDQKVAPVVDKLENEFHVEQDCVAKVKAKYVCTQTAKNDGDDPRGGLARHFACYSLKCATEDRPISGSTRLVDDQAAVRRVTLGPEAFVCTPIGALATGSWTILVSTTGPAITCAADVTQTGTGLGITGTCGTFGALSAGGSIDRATGAFTASGGLSGCGSLTLTGTQPPLSDSVSGTCTCGGPCTFTGTRMP